MKPPVHQTVPAPQPSGEPVKQGTDQPEGTSSPGLVGSYGPLIGGPSAADQDGAGADERKKP